MTGRSPFQDFRDLLARLPAGNDAAAERVRVTLAALEDPPGSLGRLREAACWLARWSGRVPPAIQRPLVAIFAASNGVAANAVSARDAEWTRRAVERCSSGAAPISTLCGAHDFSLKVFDLAVDLPTGDITREPALDERGCAATMAFGMETIAGGVDLICLGHLSTGASTVAATIFHMLWGGDAAEWVRPTGDEAMRSRRIAAVEKASALHRDAARDPLEVLRRAGGREFAAMAGAILSARTERVPVVLDGLAATAAAAVVHALDPSAIDHCMLAGAPTYPGHALAAERLGLSPLLDLRAGEGEGVSAALATLVLRSAAQLVPARRPGH